MQRILVPIDFSPSSIAAWQTAIFLANRHQCELKVLHVASPSFWEPYIPFLLEQALKEKRQEEAESAFTDWLDQQAPTHLSNLIWQRELRYGDVDEEILKTAESWNADLIVMGNGKKIDIKVKWLGTTVTAVLKYAPTEVLIVPEERELTKIEQIVFAMPFDEERIEEIESILHFAQQYEAKVNCIHFKKTDTSSRGIRIDLLKRAYRQELEEGLIRFQVIQDQTFEKGLTQYLPAHKVDLLVLMAEERKRFLDFFTSLSHAEEVINHTQVPVWILPQREPDYLEVGWGEEIITE